MKNIIDVFHHNTYLRQNNTGFLNNFYNTYIKTFALYFWQISADNFPCILDTNTANISM
jgi:hypothetical protein